jgi:hypothetical protein
LHYVGIVGRMDQRKGSYVESGIRNGDKIFLAV